MTITLYGTSMRFHDVGVHTRAGVLDFADEIGDLVDELDPIAITVEHDPTIAVGMLVYGEVNERDEVDVVAVVDDAVAGISDPVFWSPEIVARFQHSGAVSRADCGALVGMSLVSEPAGLALPPIRRMAGDIRSAGDRSTWPMSWRHDQLLERCADWHDSDWRQRTPTRLHRTAPSGHGTPAGWLPHRSAESWVSADGAQHGPMWYRTGEILRVG